MISSESETSEKKITKKLSLHHTESEKSNNTKYTLVNIFFVLDVKFAS